MAGKVSSVSFRIDSDLKAQADELFSNLGMNMTTAFNVFLRQSVREGRIPFEVTMHSPNCNRETEEAIYEARAIMTGKMKTKTYSSAGALFEELDKEMDGE